MDKLKCPFHGKIIGRDKEGNPSDPLSVPLQPKRPPKVELDPLIKPNKKEWIRTKVIKSTVKAIFYRLEFSCIMYNPLWLKILHLVP